jgi:hypothetical protein
MRMRMTLRRIRLVTTHPESICRLPSLTTRYANCLMFSVCVQQQNRLSRPPIAVVYSPATTQTRPLPSADHLLFCHRPAEPVMAGFELERQRNIYTEDGSSTFLRKVCTYSPNYKSTHPGRNIYASTLAARKRISSDQLTPLQGAVPTVYTFSRQTKFYGDEFKHMPTTNQCLKPL